MASISWAATLHPFAGELSAGSDWVDFVRSRNPAGEIGQLAQQWTQDDKRNRSLERAIPVQFVRGEVIKNANRDLVLAAAAGFAVTVDRLHAQVVAQRFNDDDTWRLRGYAVPILFPQVGDLPWEAIADLRRDRNIAWFRAKLRQVEKEATAEAAGGDIEAAAHHVYQRHLADASGRLEGIGGDIAHKTLIGFVIGGVAGEATSGIIRQLAPVAGAALASASTTIVDIRDMIRQHRSRGWVAVHQRIDGLLGGPNPPPR